MESFIIILPLNFFATIVRGQILAVVYTFAVVGGDGQTAIRSRMNRSSKQIKGLLTNGISTKGCHNRDVSRFDSWYSECSKFPLAYEYAESVQYKLLGAFCFGKIIRKEGEFDG